MVKIMKAGEVLTSDALNLAVIISEEVRKESEIERESNETGRVASENGRITTESARTTAESSRVNKEGTRVTAETGRVNAESTRVTNESARVTAESERATSETGRVNAEDERVINDTTRPIYVYTTQAEYDALSVEQKASNKHIYEITDVEDDYPTEIQAVIDDLVLGYDPRLSGIESQLAEKATDIGKLVELANTSLPKINMGSPVAKTFATFKAAVLAGTVNVVVIGDSISTTGANSLTLTDMYYYRLISMLKNKYPAVVFNVTNLAIGGTQLSEWNASKTISTVTKTWIEHVKDAAPDLLIIGFGMNHDTYIKAKVFKFHLKSMLDYITANFAKQPSKVVLTTPKPVIAGTYGVAEAQGARDMAAYSAREYGYAMDCYIVDVNRLFNVKRHGKDVTQIHNTKNMITSDAELDTLEYGSYVKTGLEYAFQTTANYMNIDVAVNNFKLYFDLKMNSFPVGSENFRIEYGNAGYPNSILIFGNRADLLTIRSYANNPDAANFTEPTAIYTAATAWSGLAYRNCWIQKVGSDLEIYVNGVCVLRDKIQINNTAGKIKFAKDGGSVGIVTVTNIKLYECEEKKHQPSLTDEMMWGAYIEGDTGTKAPYGGNGINHPSSIGLNEVYIPALVEFVGDLPV